MGEKDGHGKTGLEKPSISQAELDTLIDKMDKDQPLSGNKKPIRPVFAKHVWNEAEDLVSGEGIDQSELDALLAGKGDNELFADTPAQAKAAKEGAGKNKDDPNKPASAKSGERVLSQEEIDAMLTSLGKQ
jgi:hypothetical protein